MFFSEIQDIIFEIGQDVTSQANKLNKSQCEILRNRFTRNLRTYGVLIGNDFIAIPRDTHGNWQYYAGFEYIDDSFDYCLDEYFVYSDSDERVSDVLEMLSE